MWYKTFLGNYSIMGDKFLVKLRLTSNYKYEIGRENTDKRSDIQGKR
jgi:hypothetical protein